MVLFKHRTFYYTYLPLTLTKLRINLKTNYQYTTYNLFLRF
jgi:hypothetical protein